MSGPRSLGTVADLPRHVGACVGSSPWIELAGTRLETFMSATRARSAAEAMPFLVVSLVPWFQQRIFAVERVAAGLNYGSDLIRFESALATAEGVRATATVASAEVRAQGTLLTIRYDVESDAGETVAVIEGVTLVVGEERG